MNKQYQVGVKHTNGDLLNHVVYAADWADIPTVVEEYHPGAEVVSYENTPRNFAERYPQLMTEAVTRDLEWQQRMRELFG